MRNACLATLFLFSSVFAQETKPAVPPATPAPAPAGAPAAAPRIAPSREIIPVADTVKVLKEATLPWDIALNGNPDKGIDSTGATSNTVEVLQGPKDASIALDNIGGRVQDAAETAHRGLRLYAFTLKPNEKLFIRSKGFPMGKILMTFNLPMNQDEMYNKIKNINRLQFSTQSSRIELKNVLTVPFTAVLKLGGFCGYAYTLEIERS